MLPKLTWSWKGCLITVGGRFLETGPTSCRLFTRMGRRPLRASVHFGLKIDRVLPGSNKIQRPVDFGPRQCRMYTLLQHYVHNKIYKGTTLAMTRTIQLLKFLQLVCLISLFKGNRPLSSLSRALSPKYVPRKLLYVAFYCILMAGNVQFAFYVGCHVHCRLCDFYCILMVYILKFASENILHCLWIVYFVPFVLLSVLIAFLHCNCAQLVTCWQNQAGTISATSEGFCIWLVAAVWWSPCIWWSPRIWGCRAFYCTAIGNLANGGH